MDENNRNFLLAILLSIGVLFAWQFFFVPKPHPPAEKPPVEQSQQQQQTEQGPPRPGAQSETPSAGGPTAPAAGAAATLTREEALAQSPRIAIDTPALKGSIALKGGRIDDLTLEDYRETVDPDSPNVILLSPKGGPHAYYTEHGFVGGDNANLALPSADTVWKATSEGPLTQSAPVTLTYDNGKGLSFTRTIAVDDKYMFTVTDKVANSGSEPVTLYPYALVSRHETPQVKGYYILHEGLIGVVDDGLQEITYKKAIEKPAATFKSKEGWLGITDKYWAAVVIPEQGKSFEARFSGTQTDGRDRFQADYLMAPLTVEAGRTAEARGQVFAGAKEANLVDTLCIKILLFPLANKSYVSMSRMKKLAPEMQRIKERYADDRMRQQQAMMELYKKEKVNPASGCLPILVQIPVFFALYKVLFVTIEMRHAPFFGWIKDLSAPDPTSVFNLFGLLPFDP